MFCLFLILSVGQQIYRTDLRKEYELTKENACLRQCERLQIVSLSGYYVVAVDVVAAAERSFQGPSTFTTVDERPS